MAKVVAKEGKVAKHTKSVEVLRAVLNNNREDFRVIATGLGYSAEEVENAEKFLDKLEVVEK